tara:strand:+ start:9493 stop:9786 length:294 start_codon:yes stop_codon:yes gene_type:complete
MELAYDELYGLTPRSFNNKIKGAQSLRDESLRESWEQTRILMVTTLMPHSKKKLRAEDVLPLPWDNKKSKNKIKIATPEKIAKDVARHKKILLKNKS